jgi:hypothetical protein
LLGASWDRLAEPVRRFHGEGEIVRAAGTFRVRHGGGRLGRWLTRLAGLPAAGEAVDVRLVVVPRGPCEEWRRTFAGRPLVTLQQAGPGSLLVERMGLLELRFRLEAVAVALVYHPAGASLRLGPLRVPLPGRLAPRVSAREGPAERCDGIQVTVEIRVPLLGVLVAYEGTVVRTEAGG